MIYYLIIALIVVYAVFMAVSSLVAVYVIGTMVIDLTNLKQLFLRSNNGK